MPFFPNLERVLTYLIPRPNRGFLFKAKPEIIYDRKKELNLEEVREYYARIEKLLQNVKGNNYQTISSEKGIDKMSVNMRVLVLESFFNILRK